MITKWIKRLLTGIGITIILVLILLHLGESKIRYADSQVPDNIKVIHSTFKNDPIRYLKHQNLDSDNLIIFVHGAPGSAGDMVNYLRKDVLRKKASMISIDRLGYGYSRYGEITSIKEQVRFINEIVKKEGEDKNIFLVGHSYGGPIVGAYADDFKTEGILLLASVINPYHEKMFWVSYLTFWEGTKWLFPNYIKVAGAEKKDHEEELMEIKDVWSAIEVPVIMVHDSADYIAPGIENITWARTHIKDSLFYFHPSNDNHFVPFTNEELTTSMILRLLNN